MERLPLDLMPHPRSDWKRQRKADRIRLECTQEDPLTGVTTVWCKDLRFFRESRTDRLPNNPLYRYVSRRVEPDALPKEPDYVIESHTDGLHKEVSLEPDVALSSWRIMLQIADESARDFFIATYKGKGLHQIRVHHNSTDLMVAYQANTEQPLPQNLKALAELCRIEGAVAVFTPEIGPLHDEPDTTQKQYLDYAKDLPEIKAAEVMKAWSEEEKTQAKLEVEVVVGGAMGEHLKNDYGQEEIDTITARLIDTVTGDLPFDFNTKEDIYQRMEIIADLLVSNVAMLLTSNRDKYESLSDFTANFYFDQEDKDMVSVVIEDSDFEVIHRGHLRFCEQYRYQEHDYGIYRDSQNRVIAEVSGILRPKPKLQIAVPEEIDLERFVKYIRLPDAIGWERALEVADIDYIKEF